VGRGDDKQYILIKKVLSPPSIPPQGGRRIQGLKKIVRSPPPFEGGLRGMT